MYQTQKEKKKIKTNNSWPAENLQGTVSQVSTEELCVSSSCSP